MEILLKIIFPLFSVWVKNMGVCLEENRLACPLGEESIEVSRDIIEFLERHNYVDVIKNGKYLFTLKRLSKGET